MEKRNALTIVSVIIVIIILTLVYGAQIVRIQRSKVFEQTFNIPREIFFSYPLLSHDDQRVVRQHIEQKMILLMYENNRQKYLQAKRLAREAGIETDDFLMFSRVY